MAVLSVILTAVVVFCNLSSLDSRQNLDSVSRLSQETLSAPAVLKNICNVSQFPDHCHVMLSSVNSTDPRVFFETSLILAMEEHSKILGSPMNLFSSSIADESIKMGLKVCHDMIVEASEYLNETIHLSDKCGKVLTATEVEDIRGQLSFVIADHETCLDGLEEILDSDFSVYQLRNLKLIDDLKDSLKNATALVSNSLAIVTRILGKQVNIHYYNGMFGQRRLLGRQVTKLRFPRWLSSGDRRLLLDSNPIPNVTVAGDGSGDFSTISEAVAAVPNHNSNSRFVIYVKEGNYVENVVLPNEKWNVLMYGDGIAKTIISGSRNRVDNPTLPTYLTATFSVTGKNFIGKDIKFVNTAGPEKHQAVSFHSKSDRSVMYRCVFEGYQDTLYAHAGEQFYRECKIVGSVDFICGRAAAVFQNCDIRPRQPLPNQYNTVTAQGNSDPCAKSGFSIMNSTILAFDGGNLTSATYLGRPWKSFATTVVMKTLIGSLVDPAGWIAWNVTAGPPETLFYGEYENYGPGSGVDKRIRWVGYRPNMTNDEAQMFTVDNFINGNAWLNKTGVPYDDLL